MAKPTINHGDLSLGGLGRGIGENPDSTSETSLGGCNPAKSETETSMSCFYGEVDDVALFPESMVFTSQDEKQTSYYQLTNNSGSLFNIALADRYQNYTWGIEGDIAAYVSIYSPNNSGSVVLSADDGTEGETYEGIISSAFIDYFNYSTGQVQEADVEGTIST